MGIYLLQVRVCNLHVPHYDALTVSLSDGKENDAGVETVKMPSSKEKKRYSSKSKRDGNGKVKKRDSNKSKKDGSSSSSAPKEAAAELRRYCGMGSK